MLIRCFFSSNSTCSVLNFLCFTLVIIKVAFIQWIKIGHLLLYYQKVLLGDHIFTSLHVHHKSSAPFQPFLMLLDPTHEENSVYCSTIFLTSLDISVISDLLPSISALSTWHHPIINKIL